MDRINGLRADAVAQLPKIRTILLADVRKERRVRATEFGRLCDAEMGAKRN